MGIEPRDLGALEKAVNDAAGRASNLWISFVFFATLIAITTGTVTHKHLFLELPLKLPVLNVELPLIGYFFAVPLFFVVFHFYMLLQLDGLAAKIEDYNAVLREEHPHAADRRLLRQRLDSFIFAQVLVGARDRREGRIGALNRPWLDHDGGPADRHAAAAAADLSAVSPRGRDVVASRLRAGRTWASCGSSGRASGVRKTQRWRRRLQSRGSHASVPAPLRHCAGLRCRRQSGASRRGAGRALRWAVARKAVAAGAVVALFTTLVAVYPTEWIHAAWSHPLQPLTPLLLEGDLR